MPWGLSCPSTSAPSPPSSRPFAVQERVVSDPVRHIRSPPAPPRRRGAGSRRSVADGHPPWSSSSSPSASVGRQTASAARPTRREALWQRADTTNTAATRRVGHASGRDAPPPHPGRVVEFDGGHVSIARRHQIRAFGTAYTPGITWRRGRGE